MYSHTNNSNCQRTFKQQITLRREQIAARSFQWYNILPQYPAFILTEMVNLPNDEDDEINSVGQSLPLNMVDKYQVKKKLMPILRKITSTNVDVVQNYTVLTIKSCSQMMEKICEYILELQENGFSETKEECLQDMIDHEK
ncbi:hypothetical protein Lalb_Chr12g0204191 [Lupinus albus]|uniref:Uncharacterized protein n=1 Tax=Lupinus albus TaxID=3870 RepID=A0A6A4PNP6_LUPAL|nr:hypothetical protein Lalb_Chr12g0204191 [Lupinus albus]